VDGVLPGQYDFLNVAGHASLAGTLTLQAPKGLQLAGGDKLILVSAIGGVSGRFATVNTGNLLPTGTILQSSLLYRPTTVVLEETAGSFQGFAFTRNEHAVAEALDRAEFDPKAAALVAILNAQPVRYLTRELDAISPAGLSSMYEVSFASANIQQNNLENRMADIRSGATGFASGLNVSNDTLTRGYDGKNYIETSKDKNPYPAPIPAGSRLGVFVSGNGDFVNVGRDSNARGYDFTTGGVTVGADYRVSDNFAVGAAFGYANANTSLDNRGSVNVNSGKGGVYATLFNNSGGFYLDTYAGGGYNSYDTRRKALFGDATGATEGGEFNTFLSAGYDIHVAGLTIGPIASIQYSYVEFNQFTERGSDAPLRIVSQNQTSLRTNTGLKLAYPIKAGGILITPQMRGSWQHEFAYNAIPIDADFAGTGDYFQVVGPRTGRDSALVEAGVRVQFTPTIATFLNYDGKINPSYEAHSVNGGFDLSF